MPLGHLGAIESEQVIVGEDLNAVVVPAEGAELSGQQQQERVLTEELVGKAEAPGPILTQRGTLQ